MDTSYLWSHIFIANYEVGDGRDQEGKYHRCSNVTVLRETLKLTKGHLITVRIRLLSWDLPGRTSSKVPPLINGIFEEQTAARIQELDMNLNSQAVFTHMLVPAATLIKLTSLRKLSIVAACMSNAWFLKTLSETSPHLEEVQFPYGYDIPESWVNSGILNRLKVLHYPWSPNPNPDGALRQCTNLISLYCRNVDWPQNGTPNLHFTHLQELEVSCKNIAHLSRVALPALKVLCLFSIFPDTLQQAIEQIMQITNFSLRLPRLVTLNSTIWTPCLFFALKAPQLTNLDIETQGLLRYYISDLALPEPEHGAYTTVKHLVIKSVTFGMDVMALLRSTLNVESLRVQPSDRFEASFFNLLHRLYPPPCTDGATLDDDPLVPNLRHLTLDLEERSFVPRRFDTMTQSQIKSWAKQLIERRKSQHLPLKKVTIHWPEDAENVSWEEFE
jgi:hypothetical protein